MRPGVSRWLLVATPCFLAGCKSVSPYVSPRVEGRVVDAQNHQPIAGVKVQRLSSSHNTDQPRKGGELMAHAPVVVLTSEDGAFVLDSIRSLTFLRKTGWYSV